MSRVTRVMSGTLHPSAYCTEDECVYEEMPGVETLANAKSHVRTTGHPVIVERVTRDRYRLTE